MMEQADIFGLNPKGRKRPCGFESHWGHTYYIQGEYLYEVSNRSIEEKIIELEAELVDLYYDFDMSSDKKEEMIKNITELIRSLKFSLDQQP